MKQINIRVFGKVQGVYFRQFVLEKANELKIEGLVMNEPDGTVFIVAKGSAGQLDALVAYCTKGPERARVLNVHVEEDEVTELSGFRIIHS